MWGRGVCGFPGRAPASEDAGGRGGECAGGGGSLLTPVQGLKLCLDTTPQDSPCHLVPGQKVKK